MSASPVVTRTSIMDNHLTFPDAMAAIIRGERITKLEWENPNEYCQMRDGRLMIRRHDKWHQWLVNDGDLLGDDWIIMK